MRNTNTHTVNIHISKERESMHILMHKLSCTWTKGYGTHNQRNFDGHGLRVTSAAKAAIQKALSPNQISVSVHVCSLRPLYQLPLGGWCFTGHYIVWHMGLFLSSVQETRPSGQPQNGFWCSFHHVQLSLMSPEWNWGTNGAPLTGSSAPALGHFVVCGFFLFNFWVNLWEMSTISQCDRHTFCE